MLYKNSLLNSISVAFTYETPAWNRNTKYLGKIWQKFMVKSLKKIQYDMLSNFESD